MVIRSLLAVFLLSAVTVFAQEKAVDSQISAVTVYPAGAFVTRSAQVKLEAGAGSLVFDDIKAAVRENSLRAAAIDDKHLKIMGVVLRQEHLTEEAARNTRALEEQIAALSDELSLVQGEMRVLQDKKKYLDSIRLFSDGQMPKDLVTRMPSVQELKNTLEFLDVQLKQNSKDYIAANVRLRETGKKLTALKKQLSDLSGGGNKVKRSIVVDVQAARPGTYTVTAAYMAPQASWRPLYDARADIDKNNVELTSYALIRQSTGEDWSNVKAVVSTAKPSAGGRLPYVAPCILKPLPNLRSQEMRISGGAAYSGRAFNKEASQTMAMDGLAEADDKNQLFFQNAVAVDTGIAVSYELPKKVTIKSDNNENRVAISSQQLKAAFVYSSFPRASAAAYLGSRVANAPDLQLLAGRINIFLNNEFVGRSGIDNVGPGEEFDLYLGADDNVKVEREIVEKKIDDTILGNIPSPNKSTALKYRLKVENYKPRPIKVRLFEAMPVSQDDRIKVKLLKLDTEPTEKDWQKRRGVYMWEFGLDPSGEKEIQYSFVVEHPREMAIEGLDGGAY